MTPTITVSQSGGVTLAIEYQTGATFTGTTGSTDNAILRASGTGGSVIQGSLATIADDGTLDAPAITVDGDPVALKEATKTIFIPLSQMYGTSSHPAELISYSPVSGNAYKVLRFPDGAQTHVAEFDLFLPLDADTEAPIQVQIIWRNPGFPTATGDIVWYFKGNPFTFDESPDTNLIPTVLPFAASPDGYIRTHSFQIEYFKPSPVFWRFQLLRVAPDTFNSDAYLLGAYLTYNTL